MALVFGIGAWISINGMWVELPLLVQTLPESWNLPSFMSVIIQIANVGPIAYALLHAALPARVNEKNGVYFVMVIGTISSVLMIFLWRYTTSTDGVEHSSALLALLFFVSLVDCSSSVLFMPFMARFQQIYLTSYLIGEGLSGFLPSLFALAQGVGGNPECNVNGTSGASGEPYYPPPRFSVSVFFAILSVMMFSSAVAFIALNRSQVAKNQQVQRLPSSVTTLQENVTGEEEEDDERSSTSLPKKTFVILLAIQCWVCMLSNGALPSIQSYSCLPYGNTAYHVAVTLSSMANPVACIVAYYLPVRSVGVVGVVNIFGTAISCYIVALAALSPAPPLLQSGGEVIMIITWILSVGVFTYVRVSIAAILRQKGRGGRNLFWFGVFTQIGSTVGSVAMFLLVNVYNLFTPYYPCT